MTYKQLITNLNDAIRKNPEILGQDVTIYDPAADEFYGAHATDITVEDDVLDKGHFIIGLKMEQ